MDIQLEKANLIESIKQINDESLIKAFKNILDYAVKKQEVDQLLEESIDRGLQQSKSGQVRTHTEVMSKIRSKHKA